MTTVLESLNQALHRALQEDETVFILGEDILDPYGGAFKVSQGLSTSYPGRVFTTPVSESGIIGLATGMALRGLHPIAEIMFGDFTTLIADQVINHAAKFRYMYNDQVRVPIVIRTPMGGRRGYGPTHSQTLEKLFLG
ncbi:MAG: alpha-ketoacid dehydrogenase subunit beta, partial [Anaerolineales bacterium]